MTARRAFVAGTLAALLGAACVRRAPDAAASAPDADPVTLQVDNRYRADVVIYLLRGTARTRLGTVVTAARGTYRVPATYVGDAGGFYVVADPVGGSGVRSDRVVVHGGERIVWSLESDLARSSLAIY